MGPLRFLNNAIVKVNDVLFIVRPSCLKFGTAKAIHLDG